jgi:ADP-ribose pyrophosphatase YjhB (NUDIX family)
MKKRVRVAAIIIHDKKLLLVKGPKKYKEFWTPGGKLEEGESDIDCLKRELKEELNAKVILSKFFREYASKSPYHKNTITINKTYLIKISGKIKIGSEVQAFIWMSKKEFEEKKYPLIEAERQTIMSDLIKAGYF